MWYKIADHYKNNPVVAGYDLLNEPMADYMSDSGLNETKQERLSILWNVYDKAYKRKKIGMQALKIAIGSSLAIYIANLFGLKYSLAAGSVALLTMVTTKWKTVKLSVARVVTFIISVLMALIIFSAVESEWMAYGIYVFFVVIIAEMLGWGATISVNALIGMHFLEVRDFEFDFIANEFMLVLIGITMALVLNLFYDYGSQRKALVENMRYTEERLQMILGEISAYLANKEMQRNVWDDICALEKEVQGFIQDAYEYQDNTFQSHPGYYIDYFEMRMKQCNVIHNLHYEMKKIRHMPDEAMIISSYVFDMLVCVKEHTVPTAQLDELHELFAIIRNNSLPKTREEFESRAMLYHILMDLEEFLVFKRRFVDGLDDKKRKLYWDN